MIKNYPILIICLSSILLLIFSFGKKPIGYLHSWNQVTTLIHIEEISKNFSMWNKPIDFITRLSAHPIPKTISTSYPYEDFRIYEEFPLYHVLTAFLVKLKFSSENAAKIISILSFIFASLGLYYLALELCCKNTALLTLLIWTSSFPVLYYSQAPMSDISMTAFLIWSLYFLFKFHKTNHSKFILLGFFSLIISSLFKSYGIVFAISWFFIFTNKRKIFKGLLFIFLTSLPVISWHFWTLLQDGHQELSSHSLLDKLYFVLSTEYYLAIQKYFFRYLGILSGALTLIYCLFVIIKKINLSKDNLLILSCWLAPTSIYVIFTSDKIPHHDYYILLIIAGLIIITAISIIKTSSYLTSRYRKNFFIPLVALILLSQIPLSFLQLKKALKENPDVIQCAELINSTIPEDSLTGYLSDVSRYNSLAFYSNRKGIKIEEDIFPLTHYIPYGISHIAINLPEKEFEIFSKWLVNQKDLKIDQISLFNNLKDFKSRIRICAIWEIKPQ